MGSIVLTVARSVMLPSRTLSAGLVIGLFWACKEADHQAALAEFFEEDQAPTPPLINNMEDLGEELPGTGVRHSGGKKGKENHCPCAIAWGGRSVGKPYAKPSSKGKKGDVASYLVSL
ncbi:hypothetical protein FRC08_014958 [Ceratobasidium sp. 394]|nr:hypothetical protein FRC08_014958 [Ceratobasidium sp. 394]